jgi:UDP-GlcNAc:undecaprenyl-phosphate/decaprenyl-phosphate GlcNAc-1-phosphate transferase
MIILLSEFIIISFVLLFFISKLSYILKITDKPNLRKVHSVPIANTGGLGIGIAYILSIHMFEIHSEELNLIISISILIAIVGFIDDKYNLNIGGKLSLQLIPIIYLIFIKNFNLVQLGDYDFFKLELNSFSIPFTIISVIFLINAVNYFDGLDGTLSFTFTSTLSILYFLILDENIRFYLILLFLPIAIFMLFNFRILKLPKMFMGDSGSLLLGFIISFALIYFANEGLIHPILIAWSISIFVYEFLSVNVLRLKNKKGIFIAGQDHLHHILFKKSKSIFLTNFYIFIINTSFFILGYMSFLKYGPFISLVLFIFIFFCFLNLRNKYSKNKIKIRL